MISEVRGEQIVSHLEGKDMKLSDQGMYQCFASSKVDSIQAAAQLLLGGEMSPTTNPHTMSEAVYALIADTGLSSSRVLNCAVQ